MKKLFILLVIPFLFTSTAFSGSGTNVGGGNDGTQENYYPHDHERAPHHHDIGTEADDIYWHNVNAWCSSTRAILQEYKNYARIAQGNFGEARAYLVKGLEIALKNIDFIA